MQCAACRAVYSNALDACPRCRKPATSSASASTRTLQEKSNVTPSRHETQATVSAHETFVSHTGQAGEMTTSTTTVANVVTEQTPPISTLIEFPGAGRVMSRPPWRKELSERVREIQLRRAREAALEEQQMKERLVDAAPPLTSHSSSDPTANTSPLGLVPSPTNEQPELNPIVIAALRRLERARQSPSSRMTRRASGGAAAAAALLPLAEENFHPELNPPAAPVTPSRPVTRQASAPQAPAVEKIVTEKTVEAARLSSLVLIPTQTPMPAPSTAAKTGITAAATSASPTASLANEGASLLSATVEEMTPAMAVDLLSAPIIDHQPLPDAVSKPKPRSAMEGVHDQATIDRLEAERLLDAANSVPIAVTYEDRASFVPRVLSSILDLLLLAFLSSPFAAIIELTSARWSDPRVLASMGGIIIILTFLYLIGSTGLAGRTWGMARFSLRIVDAETALAPTTGQCICRSIFYMLSLATLGLGLLYALFDAEGRTAHDYLSGTVVVRE